MPKKQPSADVLLCKKLEDYCAEHKLEYKSADELQAELCEQREAIIEHIEWLADYIDEWDALMRKWSVTKSALARAFSKQLRLQIGLVGIHKVNERNAANADADTCASHDFCDANMAMLDAWCELTEEDPETVSASDILNDDKNLALWNSAWALAKQRGFYEGEAL
jgi:hypothetical protein